jgi:hypothetical protein
MCSSGTVISRSPLLVVLSSRCEICFELGQIGHVEDDAPAQVNETTNKNDSKRSAMGESREAFTAHAVYLRRHVRPEAHASVCACPELSRAETEPSRAETELSRAGQSRAEQGRCGAAAAHDSLFVLISVLVVDPEPDLRRAFRAISWLRLELQFNAVALLRSDDVSQLG